MIYSLSIILMNDCASFYAIYNLKIERVSYMQMTLVCVNKAQILDHTVHVHAQRTSHKKMI